MNRIFVFAVLSIAFVLGALEAALPMDHLGYLLVIQKFFTGMIPVLGVGALVKYIGCCGKR